MRVPPYYRDAAIAGYPATQLSVETMAREAAAGAHDPRIRTRARYLLAGIAANDFSGRVAAIWNWILSSITYLPNPIGAQHLTQPAELDRQIDEGTAGEACAAIVTYAAALFASVGIPSVFAIQGFDPKDPRNFRHAALIVIDRANNRSEWFDPVAAWQVGITLGETTHRTGEPLELWTLDGERLDNMDSRRIDRGLWDTPGGTISLRDLALGDTRSDIEQGVGQGLQVLNSILPAFGLPGLVAAGLLAGGQMIYEESTGRQLGRILTPTKEGTAAGLKLTVDAKGVPILTTGNEPKRKTTINAPPPGPGAGGGGGGTLPLVIGAGAALLLL